MSDPRANITNGMIVTLDNEPCDTMLVHVDPSKHTDNFYILQLIGCDDGTYAVHSRWGRTGTSGQCHTKFFDDSDSAIKHFQKIFKEKTGLEWESRSDDAVDGKYRFIRQNFKEKSGGYTSAKWQYWVDDGIDGKSTGW